MIAMCLQFIFATDSMMSLILHYFIVFKSVYMSNTTATIISKTFEGFYRPLSTSKHRHLLTLSMVTFNGLFTFGSDCPCVVNSPYKWSYCG